MTADQLVFIEIFAAFSLASLLSFWGGRVSRDKEVKRLNATVDVYEARASGWSDHAESLSRNRDDWKDRALAAETQLARLPQRGPGGRFAKR